MTQFDLFNRPSMIFQRQGCSSSNSSFIENQANINDNERVEVEMTTGSSMSLRSNSSSMANECFRFQSPTSSQTITTIASINRLSDDELTSMSQTQDVSSTMILDGRSLIKEMSRSRCQIEPTEERGGYVNVINDMSDEKFNCNTIRSSNSRCTSEIHSGRDFSCNKDGESVSIMDHNADVNQCKNVNNSINELNKALTSLVHLSPPSSSCETLKCDDRPFLNGDRCEIGVR